MAMGTRLTAPRDTFAELETTCDMAGPMRRTAPIADG